VVDRPGVLAAVAGILSEHGISIDAMQQKEPDSAESQVPLVMLTHAVRESQMNAAQAEIERLDSVADEVRRIRVEQLK
jgi:homoserine dehydrogenase